jgi:hypothetical protein
MTNPTPDHADVIVARNNLDAALTRLNTALQTWLHRPSDYTCQGMFQQLAADATAAVDTFRNLTAGQPEPAGHRCRRCRRMFGLPGVVEYSQLRLCWDCIQVCHDQPADAHDCDTCRTAAAER